MTKATTKPQSNPWTHVVLGITAFLASYGFASWAIDSGRLTAYFLSIVLTVIGIRQLIHAAKKGHAK